jgi:hypothetical protein
VPHGLSLSRCSDDREYIGLAAGVRWQFQRVLRDPRRYDDGMTSESGALRPVGGQGRSFLGVHRMEPRDDGVHLSDDAGNELAVVEYGERVYVNGRVMSFTATKSQ